MLNKKNETLNNALKNNFVEKKKLIESKDIGNYLFLELKSEMKFGDVCHSEANEVKPKNLVKVCKHS